MDTHLLPISHDFGCLCNFSFWLSAFTCHQLSSQHGGQISFQRANSGLTWSAKFKVQLLSPPPLLPPATPLPLLPEGTFAQLEEANAKTFLIKENSKYSSKPLTIQSGVLRRFVFLPFSCGLCVYLCLSVSRRFITPNSTLKILDHFWQTPPLLLFLKMTLFRSWSCNRQTMRLPSAEPPNDARSKSR